MILSFDTLIALPHRKRLSKLDLPALFIYTTSHYSLSTIFGFGAYIIHLSSKWKLVTICNSFKREVLVFVLSSYINTELSSNSASAGLESSLRISQMGTWFFKYLKTVLRSYFQYFSSLLVSPSYSLSI